MDSQQWKYAFRLLGVIFNWVSKKLVSFERLSDEDVLMIKKLSFYDVAFMKLKESEVDNTVVQKLGIKESTTTQQVSQALEDGSESCPVDFLISLFFKIFENELRPYKKVKLIYLKSSTNGKAYPTPTLTTNEESKEPPATLDELEGAFDNMVNYSFFKQ
jgi:hypothetical protein